MPIFLIPKRQWCSAYRRCCRTDASPSLFPPLYRLKCPWRRMLKWNFSRKDRELSIASQRVLRRSRAKIPCLLHTETTLVLFLRRRTKWNASHLGINMETRFFYARLRCLAIIELPGCTRVLLTSAAVCKQRRSKEREKEKEWANARGERNKLYRQYAGCTGKTRGG